MTTQVEEVSERRTPRSATIRVRVTPEVKAWLMRAARVGHVDMSDIVRPLIMHAYDRRHTG